MLKKWARLFLPRVAGGQTRNEDRNGGFVKKAALISAVQIKQSGCFPGSPELPRV
jgi:hypothetical protein